MYKPFNDKYNALGAPWRAQDGYIYGANCLVGSIKHGFDGEIPPPVVEWMKGAADVAQFLAHPLGSGLTLESTYYIKYIMRGLSELTQALQDNLSCGNSVVCQRLEGQFHEPKWWKLCRDFAALAPKEETYDVRTTALMRQDWIHRLGWRKESAGTKSRKIYGLLDEYKAATMDEEGQWDGTSMLCTRSGIVLLRSNAATLDENCPQAVPLFFKLLRRIVKQSRADNPFAPSSLPRAFADAMFALRPELSAIEDMLDVQAHMSGAHMAVVNQAKAATKYIRRMCREMGNGTSIETVLAMDSPTRTEYYEGLRRKDIIEARRDAQRPTAQREFVL